MKRVKIIIESTQKTDNDTDTQTNTYEGYIETADERLFLNYNESEIFGCSVSTQIEVNAPDRVLLKRSGGVNSVMILEKGIHHPYIYPTQFGEFELKVYTKAIDNRLTQNGGNLNLRYELSADKDNISEVQVRISAEEIK